MANATPRTGRTCPVGHTLDPNWDHCPYCAGERRPEAPKGVGRRITKVFSSDQPGGRPPTGQPDTRKIVGVLITYTWRPEGHLCPIREGKNYIGRGEETPDADHPEVNVSVPEDNRMSNPVHALILCRHGRYELIDKESSNGTFLNGEILQSNVGVDLPDNAEILTGATVWSFVHVQPPDSTGTRPERKPAGEDQHGRKRGDTKVR